MLTKQDLILLRAALTFFDEEMSPHGSQIMMPYLDEPLDPVPTASDVAELRTLIQNCQLRYVCCDARVTRLLDDRLFASMEAAERSLTHPNERVVTALCGKFAP